MPHITVGAHFRGRQTGPKYRPPWKSKIPAQPRPQGCLPTWFGFLWVYPATFGPPWGRYGSIWEHVGVTWGLLWVTLGSLWGHVWAILVQRLGHSVAFLEFKFPFLIRELVDGALYVLYV